MFIHAINPVFFSIGPFALTYYGLIYAFGFFLTYWFLYTMVKKKKLALTLNQLDLYFLWLIIGVVVGARLFEVFIYNLPFYLANPSEALLIWHGGLSFHGGLIGVIVVTVIFCRRYKLDTYHFLDLLVIPAAFALFFGRMANFINSELYGTITTATATPWCVVFSRVDNYCRHPTQLYEALKNLFIFGFLLMYRHRYASRKLYKKGTLFWLFILLYGVLRFIITFWREELTYGGLNVGQYVCVVMIVVATFFLYRSHLRH